MDRKHIRGRNVARLGAAVAALAVLATLVAGSLRRPEPPPLPPDVGLAVDRPEVPGEARAPADPATRASGRTRPGTRKRRGPERGTQGSADREGAPNRDGGASARPRPSRPPPRPPRATPPPLPARPAPPAAPAQPPGSEPAGGAEIVDAGEAEFGFER